MGYAAAALGRGALYNGAGRSAGLAFWERFPRYRRHGQMFLARVFLALHDVNIKWKVLTKYLSVISSAIISMIANYL